jgi:hypothetical protein
MQVYIIFGTAIFIAFFGYLIKYRQMTHLIAGYDAKSVKDEKKLANWVGGNLLLMALAGCLLGSTALVFSYWQSHLMAGFFIIIVLGIFYTAFREDSF